MNMKHDFAITRVDNEPDGAYRTGGLHIGSRTVHRLDRGHVNFIL